MLRFYVQGSRREPYEITAEGIGTNIVIFCRCPAGRKAGQFCKHITWLLCGDVTKLVQERSDEVSELRRRAEGSHYIAKAMAHRLPEMRDQRLVHVDSLEAVLRTMQATWEAAGWTVRFNPATTESSSQAISLSKLFKNGNLRRTPSWQLTYDEFTSELALSAETGQFEEIDVRRRERPYGVVGPSGSVGTRKHLADAAELFVTRVQQPA